jgi:tRNA 2-thiouridine synthesizing protein E
MIVNTDNQMITTDKEGFLRDLNDWSKPVAMQIANADGIELTEAHWEIIYLLREFYQTFEISPAMRPLVKFITSKLGAEKGRSIYLSQLFPNSPAKLCSKIAGLPKPENCL